MTFPEDRASLEFYVRFAAQFGADAVPFSAGENLPDDLAEFAGLLLSGGGDVEPSRYGDETKHAKTYGVNPARDAMELNLIARFIEAGKPVVGICRGLQILAVHFGGRLHQHVPDLVDESAENHRVPKGYECFHSLQFDATTKLGAALREISETNSAHHQAVNADASMRHLRVASRSPAGIIEAVECFDFAAPIIAVQWHPERLAENHPARENLAGFIRRATKGTESTQ